MTSNRPFQATFATPLLDQPHGKSRYNKARGLSEVLVAGHWVPAATTDWAPAGTRLTDVRHETSDDQ